MRREDEFRLEVISSISDEHINEATEARIEAQKRIGRKRSLKIKLGAAIAAMLILIPTLFIILRGAPDVGQVPVYVGMSISGESPLDSGDGESVAMLSYVGTEVIKKDKPIKDGVDEHFGVVREDLSYYASPGQDVYVTVKLDNPDSYEILSFTLNGKKYSSYMFESGSDMENIVLKVNVGELSGIFSYTIDAIKYVDGESIKDVRMMGERTLRIGVSASLHPEATVTDLQTSETRISFNALVTDPASTIGNSGGTAYAILYDGEEVIKKIEIPIGETAAIEFDSLSPGYEYGCAVIGIYDFYNGEGKSAHILYAESVKTESKITIENAYVTEDKVSFDLVYTNDQVRLDEILLRLPDGETVFCTNEAVSCIENLPAGASVLSITYSYTRDDVTVSGTDSVELWCSVKALPIIGRIALHYSENPRYRPASGTLKHHPGVDLVPTSDDLRVFATHGGRVTKVDKLLGTIEIVDEDGRYYLYRHIDSITLSENETVKGGEVIGRICASTDIEDIVTDPHLHFECYRIVDGARLYECPQFDTAPDSEPIRAERIYFSNDLLQSGLMEIEADAEEIVVYTTSFVTFEDDESIQLYVQGSNKPITLKMREDGQYDIVCDFSGITEPVDILLGYRIVIGYEAYSYADGVIIRLVPKSLNQY